MNAAIVRTHTARVLLERIAELADVHAPDPADDWRLTVEKRARRESFLTMLSMLEHDLPYVETDARESQMAGAACGPDCTMLVSPLEHLAHQRTRLRTS